MAHWHARYNIGDILYLKKKYKDSTVHLMVLPTKIKIIDTDAFDYYKLERLDLETNKEDLMKFTMVEKYYELNKLIILRKL